MELASLFPPLTLNHLQWTFLQVLFHVGSPDIPRATLVPASQKIVWAFSVVTFFWWNLGLRLVGLCLTCDSNISCEHGTRICIWQPGCQCHNDYHHPDNWVVLTLDGEAPDFVRKVEHSFIFYCSRDYQGKNGTKCET